MSDQPAKMNVTGLWTRKTKDGRDYWAGTIRVAEVEKMLEMANGCGGQLALFVFPNGFKQAERDPDYRISAMPKQAVRQNKEPTQEVKDWAASRANDDSDIPF